jgi:ribosomal protein S18 acetylase RimI-like enzyme
MIYIQYLNDIDQTYQDEIHRIIQYGFDREQDMLSSMNNPIVCYMIQDNKVVAVGFGDLSEADMIKPLKSKILYIHTISVDNEYRGKGLSSKIVKFMTRKYKSEYAVYLHVRTTNNNPNVAALKSYERCGFVVINPIFVERDDGPNNVMVLFSQIRPNIFNKKKTKRKTKRK